MSRQEFELKTNEQILLMRRAGLITAAALKAVREAIKPGVPRVIFMGSRR